MTRIETATRCYWRAAGMTRTALCVDSFDLALRTLDMITISGPTRRLAIAAAGALDLALRRLPDGSPEAVEQMAVR